MTRADPMRDASPLEHLRYMLDHCEREGIEVRGVWVGSAVWDAIEKLQARVPTDGSPLWEGACLWGFDVRRHDMFEPHWAMPFGADGLPIEVPADEPGAGGET